MDFNPSPRKTVRLGKMRMDLKEARIAKNAGRTIRKILTRTSPAEVRGFNKVKISKWEASKRKKIALSKELHALTAERDNERFLGFIGDEELISVPETTPTPSTPKSVSDPFDRYILKLLEEDDEWLALSEHDSDVDSKPDSWS